MYDINSHQDGYCLLYYGGGDELNSFAEYPTAVHQRIFYCLRAPEENKFMLGFDSKSTTDPSFTFAVLEEENVTSEMLLGWSASIDSAERYEMFLNSKSKLLSESEILFNNCTSSWFGPLCRFTFDYEMDQSFNHIVNTVFKSKSIIEEDVEVTCYQHLHCQTKALCLDWREICNGKSECWDDSDENNCWQLEINECYDNQFRCHNGLCIPMEFFSDLRKHPDCLDGTDESNTEWFFMACFADPTFCCEEHVCRPQQNDFSCGDGQYTNGVKRCYNGRTALLKTDFCSNATACTMKLYYLVDSEWCNKFCPSLSCMKDNCPRFSEFLYIPLIFGHVRLMFSNEAIESGQFLLPHLICYDEKLCADFLPATKSFNNFTCRPFNDLALNNIASYYGLTELVSDMKSLFRGCSIPMNNMNYCNYSTMYQCNNSTKCISKQRLLDGIQDCPFNDDETFNQSCSLSDIRQRFKCYHNGQEKCFASLVILDDKEDCMNGEDEHIMERFIQTHISFQRICDGIIDLLPRLINGQNETDETECKHWPCNNTYTRCDQFWLCHDGADEVNCPPSICPALHHNCVFPNDTSHISCLPKSQAGDGIDNCLGATDERKYHSEEAYYGTKYSFHCWNDSKYIDADKLCNNKTDCRLNDDESFCNRFQSSGFRSCISTMTDVELFLCESRFVSRKTEVYFKLCKIETYPIALSTDNISDFFRGNHWDRSLSEDPINEISSDEAWRCHRGVSIRIRMDGKTSKLYCLCPPSYYGDRCQYQNQRVSLTVQIQVSSDWRTLFIFLITLIDNETTIESYDYIEYLPIDECRNKFNIYLLYSTRPKNSSKTYSVQIDGFNQFSLNYRTSWIFPLQFPFLPIHRLPVLLKVPISNMKPSQTCWLPCIHGQCFTYINDPSSTFCRCESGWSGVQCNIQYKCHCASDSLCISDSICLCPPGRFGSRCHLFQLSSYSKSCLNGGHYIPRDMRYPLGYPGSSVCICLEGYIGDRCEHEERRSRINISFDSKVMIPSSLLIHLIAIHEDEEHNRTSIMKKIRFDQYSLIVYTSVSFNIAFVQMLNEYYLIVLREERIFLSNISTKVIPSHRCQSLSQLFNETFANEHLLKRIKSYHIPCREQVDLLCFYDHIHFCLCNLDRQANCFEFNHHMDYTCGGYNFCENDAPCFQDDPRCPTPPICGCRQCYLGSRCQFSTKGSTFSLDTILGYHIDSKSEISEQPIIVKFTISFTTFMFTVGFINSFSTFVTFQGEITRNVGCGFYLFGSSILSLIIVIVLTVKFWLLVASQIGSINNRSFVYVQCVFMDFFLRCLLSINDWLSACVAIERSVSVSKGINFNKAKSKQMAKWIILIVLTLTISTYIYDPFNRHLVDDEEEQRTWCVHRYSSSVQILDWIMNIFHFLVPFSINCISALIVIIVVARTRSNSQRKKSFKEHLREQIQQHKHLLISPLIIVILALPRLVISFLSGCMESPRDSWFYLIGYFISFIPSMMTFPVFVLPSEMYKKQFIQSIKRIWQR